MEVKWSALRLAMPPPPPTPIFTSSASGWITRSLWAVKKRQNFLSLTRLELRLLNSDVRMQLSKQSTHHYIHCPLYMIVAVMMMMTLCTKTICHSPPTGNVLQSKPKTTATNFEGGGVEFVYNCTFSRQHKDYGLV
jgi:hypothetical protein